jgi:alginate O-acetyltransferase complex protein AlgI
MLTIAGEPAPSHLRARRAGTPARLLFMLWPARMPLELRIMSLPFVLFLCAMVGLYWRVPGRWREAVLAGGSLLFYASGSLKHALLIVVLTLLVFTAGALLAERARRRTLFVAVALVVAVLAYYKYGRWLLGDQRFLAGAVPLGISFFTFEFVHYLYDSYRGRLRGDGRPPTLLSFSAFALFFPTLLAGPIKRYQQFVATQSLTREDVAYGLSRLLLGLGKKVLIADTAAGLAARLALPDQVTPHGLWLAMYAYAVQIYFDFSGYSDLAIGAARLFGYRVPENFDWPYLSTSLPEFWRRWHISLSSWIRDYLFIPLGGSRRAEGRVLFNLLFVMALCGLWHGPAWHFVAWGVWHGVGLVATHLYHRRRPPPAEPSLPRRIVTGLVTFHFVCFGWVLFAAPSVSAALTAFSRMLRLSS